MKNNIEVTNKNYPNLAAMKGWAFLFLILFTFLSPAQAQQSSGLVGWWKLDDGSGTTAADSSGNGNNGTLHNFVTDNSQWVSGKIAGALAFNGTNSSVQTTSDVLGTGPLTISLWVNPGMPAGWGYILSNTITVLYLGNSSGEAIIKFSSNATNNNLNAYLVPFNTWTYVTVTRNSHGTANVYLNGIEAGAINQNSGVNAGTGTIAAGTSYTTIGDYRLNGGGAFNGILDDIQVYNYALSNAQVSNLYAYESGAVTSLNLGTADTTPPVISNGTPNTNLPANSTQATLSVTTDKPATCRYSTTAGASYDNMTSIFSFENVDRNSDQHSVNVSGLQNGQSYTYYVRCMDTSYNENMTDYPISFSVQSPQAASGTETISSESLVSLPNTALWSTVVNFRPGNEEIVHLNPPRFSWTYLPNPTGSSATSTSGGGNNTAVTDVETFIFQVAANATDLQNQANLLVNIQTLSNSYNFLPAFNTSNGPTFYWRIGYINNGPNYQIPQSSTISPPTSASSVYQWSTVKSFTIASDAVNWDRSYLTDISSVNNSHQGYLANHGVHPHLLFTDANKAQLDQYLENYGGSSWQAAKAAANTTITSLWWPLTNPASSTLTSLTNVSLVSEGTNYKVGDVLSIAGGSGATVMVTGVNPSNGAVLAITGTSGGSGYTSANGVATADTNGPGAGATVNISTAGIDLSSWPKQIGNVIFVWQMTQNAAAGTADNQLNNAIANANPAQALVNLANYYLSINAQTQDIVACENCGDMEDTLAYGYDWLYNSMSVTNPTSLATILKALKSRALYMLKGDGWFYASADGANNQCAAMGYGIGDPTGAYPCGEMNIGGAFQFGTSHESFNFAGAIPIALSAYNDDPDIREFFDLALNYMVGVTFSYGHDGSVNQGRGYAQQDIFNTDAVLTQHILAQITFPEAQFNLNPYWKTSAQWWDAFEPINLTEGHEPWGDDWYGAVTSWNASTFGQDLGYFLNDSVAYQHWINENALVPTGTAPLYYQLPIQFYFNQPTEQNSTRLSELFPESGWAMGCSLPYNTSDCFNNGVGYVFQARPSGGANSHDYWSDLSYQIWAYGTTITDASAMYPDSYAHQPLSHYSLLVNGISPIEPLSRYLGNSGPGPNQPYYNYIFAHENTADYDYVAADGTNGYPTTNYQGIIDTTVAPFPTFEQNESGAPLAGLQKVRRHILFVHHKYFVIYDDFANATPATFTAPYHVLENTLTPNFANGGFSYTSNIQKYIYGSVSKVAVGLGGAGYNVGDVLNIIQPGDPAGSGATITVSAINPITGMSIVNGGSTHYYAGDLLSLQPTVGTGSGAYAVVTAVNNANGVGPGSVTAVALRNNTGGSGYSSCLANTTDISNNGTGVTVNISTTPGMIAAVSLISAGTEYTTASNLATSYVSSPSGDTESGSGATINIATPANRPVVPVFVQYINAPNTLNIWDLTGNQVALNPILCGGSPLPSTPPSTCENYWGDYFSNGENNPRAHAIWVSNKTPSTAFHLITVIYPENPADVTAGNPAPVITRIDDNTAKVINPDLTTDVISFDPSTAAANNATMIVDLVNINPASVFDSVLNTVPTTSTLGDVSNNGTVTMYDAALALQDLSTYGGVCSPSLTPQQCANAEMDGLGQGATIDSTDVTAIAKKALGL